jgi:hypothetical protein
MMIGITVVRTVIERGTGRGSPRGTGRAFIDSLYSSSRLCVLCT